MKKIMFMKKKAINRSVILACVLLVSISASFGETKTAKTGNWGVNGNWSPSGVPAATDDIVIPIGVTMTVNGNYNCASIVVTGTLAMNSASYDLIVTGNFSGTGTLSSSAIAEYTVGGNWTFAGTSTSRILLRLNGTANQTLSGAITNSASASELIINKASGAVNLGSAITLSSGTTLNLTNGIINTTSTNKIIFSDGSLSTGGSSASYINGPITKIGDDNFTVSAGSGRIGKCGINNTNGATTDAFSIEYAASGYADVSVSGGGITSVSSKEYWDISQTAGASTVTITLYYSDGSYSGITATPTTDNLFVAHYNGADWTKISGGTASVGGGSNTTSGSVSITNVSSFSPFTFGSDGGQPLPVTWVLTNANVEGNNAKISWATATEINNDRFIVERSMNGTDFVYVGEVKGQGNSNQLSNYFLIDNNAALIPTANMFYRVKQIDYNGEYEYSSIVKLALAKNTIELKTIITPNPFNAQLQLTLPVSEAESVTIKLMTLAGTLVMEETQSLLDSRIVTLNTEHLPVGIYMVHVNQNGEITNYKIIKN